MNLLPPLLPKFADLVLLHPEWEAGIHAQHLGVSLKTLARQCSLHLGLTPKQWLLSYRMRSWRIALQEQTDVLDSALEHFGALSSAYRHAAHALGMSPASIRRGGAGAWLVIGCCMTAWGQLVVAQTAKGVCWVCVHGNPETFTEELSATYPNARLVRMDARFAHWANSLSQRWPLLASAALLPEEMLLALLQHHLLEFVLQQPLPNLAPAKHAQANKLTKEIRVHYQHQQSAANA
jgi:AraC family transcriptional regulator, regulatory protein of adaptative response / methylated-DNA-[protein]-cysteine methyltransferase